MKTPHQKGKELEDSVYFIQKTILESDPKYRGQEFTLTRNEIFNAGDVHHEIDILVCVNPRTDYEAKLIFECKNWSASVGKNEVIVLAEKVDALSASRGFLVAKEFSKDAVAQAKKNPRIKLVSCSSDFQSALTFELVSRQTELLTVHAYARIVGPDKLPMAGESLSIHETWMLRNSPVSLATLIRDQSDTIYEDHFKRERSRLTLEGLHYGIAKGRVEFEESELISESRTMEWLNLHCDYRVTNTRCKLLSKFELKGYGRTYSYEPFETGGKAVEVTMVIRMHSD